MRFPSIAAVAADLRIENERIRCDFTRAMRLSDGFCGDVRLQVWDGGWRLHTGDSQYDQDHRGYWGSSSLNGERFNAREMAKDLIEQCREMRAQGDES